MNAPIMPRWRGRVTKLPKDKLWRMPVQQEPVPARSNQAETTRAEELHFRLESMKEVHPPLRST